MTQITDNNKNEKTAVLQDKPKKEDKGKKAN